jgi:hypothetical protein
MAAAEVALLHLLEARASINGNPLQGVPLSFGFPETLQAEHLWVGEETTATQQWQITGNGSQAKTETAELEVWVWVVTPGNDYVTSRDRALDMAGEIEKAVRDDWRLEGEVFDASVVRIRKRAAPTGQARGLFLTIDVEYVAWLS